MLWQMSQLTSNCTLPEIIGFLFLFGTEGIVRVVVKDEIRWRVFVKFISFELKFEFYSNTPIYRTIWGYGKRCSKSGFQQSGLYGFSTWKNCFQSVLVTLINSQIWRKHNLISIASLLDVGNPI